MRNLQKIFKQKIQQGVDNGSITPKSVATLATIGMFAASAATAAAIDPIKTWCQSKLRRKQ